MTSPPRGRSGYPAAATTTVTAYPSRQVSGAWPASVPVAAALSRPASGVCSSASTTCVSGSPKRALNSTTRVPLHVSASPAYSRPANGVPRRRISSTVGCRTSRSVSSTRVAGAQDSGAYAPMPPVFGPSSPSATRLKSCAGSSGTTVVPSVIANSETSGPSRYSSITTRAQWLACSSATARSVVTTTPLPAASPSSLTT